MALLLGIESSSEYCTVLLCENGEIKSIVLKRILKEEKIIKNKKTLSIN